MTKQSASRLGRIVADEMKAFPKAPEAPHGPAYDRAIARVTNRISRLLAQIEHHRARVRERYRSLVDEPEGRRRTVLENSEPALLVVMAYDLLERSFARRFDDPGRSLELARFAHEVAESVARTGYLAEHSAADLLGEALDHLGNARRINSDLLGADLAFVEAQRWLDRGTGDRDLKATHLGLLGTLRLNQGQAFEAAGLFDRQINLRRLLDDPTKLGSALIDRGLVATCTDETLGVACELIHGGVALVDDARTMFLGLLHLAEAFARRGDGLQASKILRMCHLVSSPGGFGGGFERQHRWVEGVTYRALGDASRAERILKATREAFGGARQTFRAAAVALDLLPVLAARGKVGELAELTQAAYREFAAASLSREALSVFMIAYRAAQAERLAEELAVRVANFVVRYQSNRSLRFEDPRPR